MIWKEYNKGENTWTSKWKIIIAQKLRELLTLIELSVDALIRTGSFAKKWSEIIELSWASLITDCNLLFSRFHILMTPDVPPDANRGCPSEIKT